MSIGIRYSYPRIIVFFFVLASLTLATAMPINAQEAEVNTVSLNVTPTVIELDANPGERQEGSFKVVNGSDIALELTTTPKNFTASDELGGVNLTEDETSFSLASWVSVEPSVASVAARGSQIFNYTIDIPSNAEPGGHFGSIIVNTQAVRIDETGPAVAQEVGPLILVKIAGDTFQEATIVEFATQKDFLEAGPVTFSTRINNTGNVHFKPKGTIEIKDTFGRVVTTIDLEEKNVLPDAIRRLTNDWSPTGFTVGRYTADLTLVYGVNDEIVTASTTFTVFPYKIIIPFLIGLIALFFFIIKHKSRVKKALSVLKDG